MLYLPNEMAQDANKELRQAFWKVYSRTIRRSDEETGFDFNVIDGIENVFLTLLNIYFL